MYTQLARTGYLALEGQLRGAEWLLRSVQTLFLASDEVTEAEFADFYENLHPREQFPSLVALAYAQREMQPDGEHYVVRWCSHAVDNQALRGLDLSAQPHSLADVLRSRDADRATLSAPFRLVQSTLAATPGDAVTMRLPVFSSGPPPRDGAERRARVQGSISVSYRVAR